MYSQNCLSAVFIDAGLEFEMKLWSQCVCESSYLCDLDTVSDASMQVVSICCRRQKTAPRVRGDKPVWITLML